jgi:hypothetical protein
VRGYSGGVGGADRSTEKEGKEIQISIETQKLGWYVNLLFDAYLRDTSLLASRSLASSIAHVMDNANRLPQEAERVVLQG